MGGMLEEDTHEAEGREFEPMDCAPPFTCEKKSRDL